MKKPDYNWWIENAHTDSSLLLLMSDEFLFDQAIQHRCGLVGRTDVQGVINQAKYRAMFEQDRFGSMSSIVNAITAPVSLSSGRPINGEIRVDGRSFRDNVGHWPVASISAFWIPWALKNDLGRLERLAEYASSSGFSAVRWFSSHNWHGGLDPRSTPNYWDIIHRSVEKLAEFGLRSEITLFTRRFLIHDVKEHAKEIGLLAQSSRENIALIEIANEFNHSHNKVGKDDTRLAAESVREHCSGVPLALSAPASHSWEDMKSELSELYTGSAANCTTIHFPRKAPLGGEEDWRWVRQPWHSRFPIAGCPETMIDNEHQKWSKAIGGRCDVAVPVSAVLTAFVAGCGFSNHHDESGVFPVEEYHQVENAQLLQSTFSRVLKLLPGDIAKWTRTRVGDGGPHPYPSLEAQHWTFNDIDSGVSRAFAAVNGNQFVMTLTGVRNKVTLNEEHSEVTAVSLRTGETVHTGNGSVTLTEGQGSAFLVIGTT